ncbi:MAG TPA: alpha/beta hydrolase [Myxococcales bacterium]|nr:alpha/beta hydrolase [Myxococcales bacterium]
MNQLPARDGRLIGYEFFAPESPRGCVLIAAAMAVPARFYSRYAEYLSTTGLAALAVDYRGIGSSKSGSIKDDPATFHDWGEQDLGGAVDFLLKRYPGLPLHWIGHSAGGQLMGLLPDAPIASALFIASGSAYWRAYRGRPRAIIGALFHGVLPAMVAINGYLPMRRFRQGEDVPKGVAREWAEWGRHPRYVRKYADKQGGLGFDRYTGPLRAVAFSDDSYAPKEAVQKLLELYPNARKELILHQGPAGHFGFFKQASMWREPTFSVAPETK